MSVDGETPDPAPFFLEAGTTGVLLLHGFTGSPSEMRLVGDYLHDRGITVSAPLLPGHGTRPEELNQTTWEDWCRHVDGALAELRRSCNPVFIGALSLGSLLALNLAAKETALSGIVLYSPPTMVNEFQRTLVRLFKDVVALVPKVQKWFSLTDSNGEPWAYDMYPTQAAHQVLKLSRRTRRRLRRVRCPLLILYGTEDTMIDPQSPELTYRRVRSEDKQIVALEDAGHALTVESRWETVAELTYEFVRSRSPSLTAAELARTDSTLRPVS